MVSILSQYCIYVSDIERAIGFWRDVVGIPLVSETDIPNHKEAILQSPHGGSRMQLAQKLDDDSPDRHGHRDVEALRQHRRLPGPLRPGDRARGAGR